MTVHNRSARTSVLVNVAVALGVVLLCLGLAELFVRLFVPVRSVGPAVTVFDPVYGTRLKRNFKGVQITPEFRMHLSTNSLGFRGPEPSEFPRRGVLYLGDSFTVGYGVDDGEEYPAIVSQRLAAAGHAMPYVNDGRGNTGQSHWVKFLRQEAARYEPRAVVFQINETDFEDNVRERQFALDSTDSLVQLPPPSRSFGRVVGPILDRIPLISNSYLLGLVRQAYLGVSSGPKAQSARATPAASVPAPTADSAGRSSARPRRGQEELLLARLLGEASALCERNHWPAVALRAGLKPDHDALVDSVLSAHGVRSTRIPPRSERPDLYFAVDGHWNTKGQAVAAQEVLGLLAAIDSASFGGLGSRP